MMMTIGNDARLGLIKVIVQIRYGHCYSLQLLIIVSV